MLSAFSAALLLRPTLVPRQAGKRLGTQAGRRAGGHSGSQACKQANRQTFDDAGWMRTGDIGYYDTEGFVYIVDRMKELIKVKGLQERPDCSSLSTFLIILITVALQVAPAELEDVLRGLSGVEDVAVIGVPSSREGEGELPRAYIVRSHPALTEVTVHQYMRDQVAPHKQLAGGVQFVEEIPKSAAGKILRKDLKAKHGEETV